MRLALKLAGFGALGALALGTAPLSTLAQATSTATSTSKVTIAKFVDGQMATASSTGSAVFPMSATWMAANLNGGATSTGTFSLGTTGFNTPTPYQAVSADMTAGAHYATNEQTGGSVVGTDCSGTQLFRLAGYSTGNTLAQAQAAPLSTTSPSFVNLTSDKFVIVWNRYCLAAPMLLSPANGTSTTTAGLALASWTSVTNPVGGITYTFQSSHASTTDSTGAFATPLFTSSPLATTSIAISGTPPGTYFWHVKAQDAHGNMSTWSPTSSFIVTNNGTSTGTSTPPSATSTVKVHIEKFLDGNLATASSSNNTLFPMSATWMAANLNGGATTTGTFSLGNGHGGASVLYGADTSPMDTGANYATNEVTGTSTQFLPIGVDCQQGKFQLVGYTSSPTSFAAAAAMTPSATAPSFTNLQGDQFVIVWNRLCGSATTTPPGRTGSLWVQKFSIGGDDTFTLHGNHGIGSFTITTSGGFGSKTLTGLTPGFYSIHESQLPDSWRKFINTCHHVMVRPNQLAFCFIVNRLPVNQWDTMGEDSQGENDNHDSDRNENTQSEQLEHENVQD